MRYTNHKFVQQAPALRQISMLMMETNEADLVCVNPDVVWGDGGGGAGTEPPQPGSCADEGPVEEGGLDS